MYQVWYNIIRGHTQLSIADVKLKRLTIIVIFRVSILTYNMAVIWWEFQVAPNRVNKIIYICATFVVSVLVSIWWQFFFNKVISWISPAPIPPTQTHTLFNSMDCVHITIMRCIIIAEECLIKCTSNLRHAPLKWSSFKETFHLL